MQTAATLAALATVTLAGNKRCATTSYVAPSYKVAARPAYGYSAPAYGYGRSYGGYDDRAYGESYSARTVDYREDVDVDSYDYDLGYGYGARGYGYGNNGYGRRSFGGRAYGRGVGRRGHKGYGGRAYGRGYGARSYGGRAYGARSYGYDRDYDYGYGRDLDYGYGRGYGYEPVVVKKDYGLWENYYRLEVETFQKTVVTDTENVWVVAYIDPACGGCKRLATQWERLTTLETITVRKVKFGYVDITVEANREILETYTAGARIESTPIIYLYGQDKYAPTLYYGDYTVDSLNDYICGYCDDYGFGVVDYGYGYDDDYYGDYDYGYAPYGRGRRSYGYDARPQILSTYSATNQRRVEDIDYDRTVREGRSYGGYERTTVEPAYPSYGHAW